MVFQHVFGLGAMVHPSRPATIPESAYRTRLLRPPEVAGHLHVLSAGCSEVEQMLLFRDWLRSHAEDRVLYERTKQELASRTWTYTQDYADAKTDVIQQILRRARSRLAG